MLTLHSISFAAMGAECCLDLYVDDLPRAEAVADSAIAKVLGIEERYSRYRSDGILSQINRATQSGIYFEVDEEISGLLDCLRLFSEKRRPIRHYGGYLACRQGFFRGGGDLPEQSRIDQLWLIILGEMAGS